MKISNSNPVISSFPKLQYISQGPDESSQLNSIKSALDGGCLWVQFRHKQVSISKFHQLAEKVKTLCEAYNATLIINDYPTIAKQINADGVHLGLDDMPVSLARTILGPDKIIGGTANTWENLQQRILEKVDYIGLGPFAFTKTKEKLSPVLGLDGYKQLLRQQKEAGDHTPVYAIGGITVQDVDSLLQVGVYGLALSGAITHAYQPKILINNLNHKLYETT